MKAVARSDSARWMQNRDVTGLFTFRVQRLLHLQRAAVSFAIRWRWYCSLLVQARIALAV